MKMGKLFVISAPSGSGKTSLIRALLTDARCQNLEYAVSHTTRTPRPGEKDGQDYVFVSQEIFKAMIEKNEFLEWNEVFGRYYGTGRARIMNRIEQGKNIVVDVDVVGARSFKENYKDANLIFVVPPTLTELTRRLMNRRTEDEAAAKTRLARVATEVSQRYLFDYLLINDDLTESINELEKIINYGQGSAMADMELFWPKFFDQEKHLDWCPEAWETRPVIPQP